MKKCNRIIIFFVAIIIVFSFVNQNKIEKFFYPIKYSKYVEYYSKHYDLDKYLVYSIIKTESNFNPKAVSNKGAKGLMQITDVTAKWGSDVNKFGKIDIFDPETNIKLGTWYLNRLKKEFNGDLKLMISAYNGGSGNVRRWLRSEEYSVDGKSLTKIPFKETSKYNEKVIKNYKKYKEIYMQRR